MSAAVDLICIAPHSMSAQALSVPIGAANTADTAIGSYASCNMILHIVQGVAPVTPHFSDDPHQLGSSLPYPKLGFGEHCSLNIDGQSPQLGVQLLHV